MSPLGDGAGTPADVGVSTFLLIGAALFALVAARRLRGRGFLGTPRAIGWLAGGAAAACLVLAFALPPLIRPDARATRPSSTATLAIVRPAPGESFAGRPATVAVVLRLAHARIVRFTSTRLTRDTGHIHLLLDGALVSMTFGTSTTLQVAPGRHILEADFVAVDHAPFAPPVRATVSFVVRP